MSVPEPQPVASRPKHRVFRYRLWIPVFFIAICGYVLGVPLAVLTACFWLGLGTSIRSWFIGGALIAGGIAVDVVFVACVSPYAGRMAMGSFAMLEGFCYGCGLVLFFGRILRIQLNHTDSTIWHNVQSPIEDRRQVDLTRASSTERNQDLPSWLKRGHQVESAESPRTNLAACWVAWILATLVALVAVVNRLPP